MTNFYIANAAVIIGGSYALMPAVERFTRRLGENFNKANAVHTERKVLDKGLKSMIPIVAIVIMARVISPFISTFLADKFSKKQN